MGERARILAVEPDPGSGEVLWRTLTDSYDLTIVRTGRAAIETLSSGMAFDLVLLNTDLPDASGQNVLAEMGQEFPALPVAMIMSTQEVRTFVQVMELGAVDYVVKPFHPGELRFLIDRFVTNLAGRLPESDHESAIQFAC